MTNKRKYTKIIEILYILIIFMKNNIENTSPENKLENLINEQSLLIFDEQDWIGKDLWKTAEVTYSYDEETKINTTLFVK